MATYAGDPYWLVARRPGTCAGKACGHAIKPGDRIFWYPRTRDAFVGPCAGAASRDFNALAADEEMLGG